MFSFSQVNSYLIALVHLFEVLLEILFPGACELHPYHCLCLHEPDGTIGTRARSRDNSNLSRVRVRVRVMVRVRVRVSGGGLFPTTSHSVVYTRVGHWG